MRPVLVVGAPRSGTTWIAQVLAAASGACYLEEPDNHLRFAFAFRAKRRLGLGAYPSLAPEDARNELDDYARLWREALTLTPAGGREALRRCANALLTAAGSRRISTALGARHLRPLLRTAAALAPPERTSTPAKPFLVVKSVYAPLAAEWLAARHELDIVAVLRDPRNVVSSWLELGWLPPAGPDPVSTLDGEIGAELARRFGAGEPPTGMIGRAAWLVGLLTCALDDATRRQPAWRRVLHEDLCRAPREEFPALAAGVGLPWSTAGDRLLRESDRPGTGYETARLASALPTAWERRLTTAQVREVEGVLSPLRLPPFSRPSGRRE